MVCGLCSYKEETPIYYIGNSGNKYDVNKFCNYGTGERKYEKDDLPLNEYPYSIEYKTEFKFNICNYHQK